MTELLYYKDQYLKETEAEVVEIREGGVVFDQTIFYPECGGQPGDRGFFGSHRIRDTRKDKDGTPLHIFDGELPQVGEKRRLSLDWDHRYFYMKEHSAQHLLSAILYHSHGIGTVAVHQGEEILTIETDQANIPLSLLLSVEEEAVREIGRNRRIEQKDMTREEAESLNMRRTIKVDSEMVKVVFIEGLDAVACGGVHLGHTGEIGELCFRGTETIRGHQRTIWSVGERARDYRRGNERALKEVMRLLSSEPDNVGKELERILDERAELKREIKESRREKVKSSIISHLSQGEMVFSIEEGIEEAPEILSPLVSGKTVFLAEEKGKKGFVFFGTKAQFEAIKASVSLKGGGREPMFRGTLTEATDEAVGKVKEILHK